MSKLGDKIQLAKQEVEVVACEKCEALMVNIDEKQLQKGDMRTLLQNGVRISNPHTKDPVCLTCEIEREDAESEFKHTVNDYFEQPAPKPDDDDDEEKHDDDSHLFGGFGSGSSDEGFGSGDSFGGFGGGSFSGAGASGDF